MPPVLSLALRRPLRQPLHMLHATLVALAVLGLLLMALGTPPGAAAVLADADAPCHALAVDGHAPMPDHAAQAGHADHGAAGCCLGSCVAVGSAHAPVLAPVGSQAAPRAHAAGRLRDATPPEPPPPRG